MIFAIDAEVHLSHRLLAGALRRAGHSVCNPRHINAQVERVYAVISTSVSYVPPEFCELVPRSGIEPPEWVADVDRTFVIPQFDQEWFKGRGESRIVADLLELVRANDGDLRDFAVA